MDIKSLFGNFKEMSNKEQIDKIRHIRKTRTIDKPKTALRKVKAAKKKSKSSADALADMMLKMSDEQLSLFTDLLEEKEDD